MLCGLNISSYLDAFTLLTFFPTDETLPGMDGDGHTTSTLGDDNFATARGYLTLESQHPLTESEIRQYYSSQLSTDDTSSIHKGNRNIRLINII